MLGTKPSNNLGTNFFIQLSVRKSTAIVSLRPIVLLLPHRTHSMMGKPWLTTGIHATVGLCLIKDDCRKNNYKQGCSPNPTDGSTSSFPRVRDRPDKHHQPQEYQKRREQEKGGKDEDIASWTKRDSKAVSSGRGDS